MSFLLAEILGLLALAGIAGGAFTYWWARRNFVDVSSDYQSLQERMSELDELRRAKAASDSRVAALESELDAMEVRLNSELEWRDHLKPTLEKLTPVSLDPVLSKLDEVNGTVAKIRPADLTAVDTKLGALESNVAKLKMLGAAIAFLYDSFQTSPLIASPRR